ncbi:MAG: hypothetical protein HRT88_18580, partial [Lentisphaeraceae bacterium]|nr:hypothetical protein [Lentisphaeraceae bacterium]
AKQAVYGAIYPADERILLNLDTLRKELGTELFEKYSHLCIGAAVTRRKFGVGVIQSGNRKLADLQQTATSLIAEGIDPQTYFANYSEVLKINVDSVKYQKISDYLEKHNILPRQAFDNLTHRTAMEKRVGGTRMLERCLKKWLLEHNMRPNKNSPSPKVSEFIKYLDSILSIPARRLSLKRWQKWPLFPVATTPWPILMPLSKTWPIADARYIFERYQGLHEGKRYQTYGPYFRFPKGISEGLEPCFDWNRGDWALMTQSGGICGTMSNIASGAMTSLGIPMLKASQPGHSCIVRYNQNNKGQYMANAGQTISGPLSTDAKNLFDDIDDPLLSAKSFSYHLALSQAMNVGLDSYMDVRIALHLYKALNVDSQLNTKALQLLRNALEFNPFHLEAWLTVAQLKSPAQLLTTLQDFIRLHKTDAVVKTFETRDANEDLGEDIVDEDAPAGSNIALLKDWGLGHIWRLGAKNLKQYNSEELKDLYEFVLTEVNNGQTSLRSALASLSCIVKGEAVTLNLLKNDISEFLSTGFVRPENDSELKEARKDHARATWLLIKRTGTLCRIVQDRELLHESMRLIMSQFTEADKITFDTQKRPHLSLLYKGICDVYSIHLSRKKQRNLKNANDTLRQSFSVTSEDPATELIGE